MILCPMKLPRRSAGLVLLLATLLAPGLAPARSIDLNGNGMSDIWELIYGASNLDPNGDADGDGASNLLESIAGTNPFDSNSVPKIVSMVYTTTNFSVSMPSALGKQYELQSTPAVGSGSLDRKSVV